MKDLALLLPILILVKIFILEYFENSITRWRKVSRKVFNSLGQKFGDGLIIVDLGLRNDSSLGFEFLNDIVSSILERVSRNTEPVLNHKGFNHFIIPIFFVELSMIIFTLGLCQYGQGCS